ncbi:MAG: DUF4111 domain-containing protein [Chloroflexota bacterium]|nr:DUF4111 domain-containing protein [Chloroflexota bacterium]
MSQYGWTTCPPTVKQQIDLLVEQLQAALGTNLVGVYLHGSLAMGCFNPAHSDIDILVVIESEMPVETKRSIAELLLHSSKTPCPIEISFVVEREMHPFQHPLPFAMHYSESWRERYRKVLAHGDWMQWNDDIKRDTDLAAHFTVTRERGICLVGKPIKDVFPPVPEQYYILSITGDFQEVRDNRLKKPVYYILNACRIYAYLCERYILSKDEGGSWGLHSLPAQYHNIIKQALDLYKGNRDNEPFDEAELEAFSEYMHAHIH